MAKPKPSNPITHETNLRETLSTQVCNSNVIHRSQGYSSQTPINVQSILGPPPPDTGSSSTAKSSSGSSSSSSKQPSNKAHPTLADGDESPYVDKDGHTTADAPEDVRRHNEEIEKRADRPTERAG